MNIRNQCTKVETRNLVMRGTKLVSVFTALATSAVLAVGSGFG